MKRIFELIDQNLLKDALSERDRSRSESLKHPIITISREYGSGGSEVAKRVCAQLGKDWKVYHKEIVSEIAKEAKLEKKLIREVDEKRTPLIEEITGDFFGKRYMSLHAYSRHLLKILSTIGTRGHAIIIGRGASFLFPDALKIRITADMNTRIKTLMEFEKLSPKKAEQLIEKRDSDRYEFMRSVYQHDHKKAHHYDLVIRISDLLTINDAVKIIVDVAKRKFRR